MAESSFRRINQRTLACAELRAQEPKKESWGTSAIFEDPDGNKFVLSSR